MPQSPWPDKRCVREQTEISQYCGLSRRTGWLIALEQGQHFTAPLQFRWAHFQRQINYHLGQAL